MSNQELAEFKRALDERNRTFEAHFAAKDARGLVESYFVADDVGPVASPPGAKPSKGRAALIEMFSGQVRDVKSIRLETLDLEVSGDLGYEFGRGSLSLKAGPVVQGRYLVIWKRTREGWRAKLDFFAEGWSD
jgi:ketosteroid isomerase-like protein